MKKSFFLLGFIFSFVGMYAQQTQIKTDKNGVRYEVVENDPSQTRIYTLDNGLKIYLSQIQDEPRIQTHIAVRTGSNNDPEDNTGLAHYLEHMLFKGTSKIGTTDWEKEKVLLKQISDLYEAHKVETDLEKKAAIYKQIDELSYEASKYAVPNEYDKLISSIGASGTNAHTWYDETIYHNNIPSNELERWMIIEAERFSELVLRLFHTELETVYEEFNRAQDNDSRLVSYAMTETLFPNSHYGTQTTLGSSEHLKNPSMEAIHQYFDEYYVPNNITVILVGDFEYEKAYELTKKHFGTYKKGVEPKRYVAQEKPLTQIQEREVFSPSSESMLMAFRTGGANSEDAKYVEIIDMILSNGNAGLIDLNIRQKQATQRAGSYTWLLKDYGAHYFSGTPKQGQTLEEVRDILLEQIEKVKKGEFDSWLIEAVVNDLKKQRLQRWESPRGLAREIYGSIINELTWEEVVKQLDEMSKITKQEIVEFANKFYKDNYVIVYKRQGENKNLIRVENPGITPIVINREAESDFYKSFQNIKTTEVQPVFVDFDKQIKTETFKKAKLSFIENKTNDISSLYYITEVGSDHDKKLSLAINYLDYLGTSKYSAEEVKKEFYKLGINYGVGAGAERTFVYLTGLQQNLDKGILLLEHLIKDAKADQKSYDDYVDKILKDRTNAKTQKGGVQAALNQYVMFGENSRFRDVISEEELKATKPEELVKIVQNFLNYDHQIFYYGNDLASTKNSLAKHHNFSKGKKVPAKTEYPQPMTDGKVYFAPYDMVQAEISFRARGSQFDKNLLTASGLFNEYFGSGLSSIVFQEIRESKSLAYSAYSAYSNASQKDRYNYLMAYVGTQANKLPEAVDAMMDLMNNMPKAQNQFNSSKEAALKRIATQRYTKSSVFFYWLNLQDRGIDYDINKDIYEQTQKLTLSDLETFFNQNVKGQKFNVGLIGKKENLDWQAVQKLGEVKELTLEELFGY